MSKQHTNPSSHNSNIIDIQDLTKCYGDNVVLKDFTLKVDRGEKVTLIGPSGSGKTTVLRTLMTLVKPDSGLILINGEPLWHEKKEGKLVDASPAHLRKMRNGIGMVFQQFNLFPHMTVLENVSEALIQVKGMQKEAAFEKSKDVLERVGMQGKKEFRPWQLSGGQQQRVAIARAIALEPEVMLFDEVTSALDPELVGEVLSVLRDLAVTTDITMLLVTHEMRFAADIADQVVMFDQGRVVEKGPPEQVLKNPEEARTRSFLKAVLDV